MTRYDAWFERGWDECEDDIECWERFYYGSFWMAISPEGMEKIDRAFFENLWPRLWEKAEKRLIEEFGTDLRAWFDFIESRIPEFQSVIIRELRETLTELARDAIETALLEPEAEKTYRTYMEKIAPHLIEVYFEHGTQAEVAARSGYSLHSVWNTVWWLRKYTDIDLWPGWGG